jgi:hypothetical protein
MLYCANCENVIEITGVRCSACGLSYEGTFHLPRLARLGPAHQTMVEEIVLAAGNLKEVAGVMEVSFPTLRKRLDALIMALRELRAEDEARTRSLLDEVEAGRLTAEAAARLIKEMNGGA